MIKSKYVSHNFTVYYHYYVCIDIKYLLRLYLYGVVLNIILNLQCQDSHYYTVLFDPSDIILLEDLSVAWWVKY